jgi:hypothetical protein
MRGRAAEPPSNLWGPSGADAVRFYITDKMLSKKRIHDLSVQNVQEARLGAARVSYGACQSRA